jgi:hypothetical protein
VDLLVNNGMYIETSLQNIDCHELKSGLLTVGVDGDDIASLADMLKNNQSDLETHLQRVLAADYEAGVDAYGESPAPARASTHVVEPSALTLVGTRVRQPLLDHVDLSATQYLWKFPIRKEAAVRMLILSALLVLCTAGLLRPRGRKLVGKIHASRDSGAGICLHLDDRWRMAAGARRRVEPELHDVAESLLGAGGKPHSEASITALRSAYANDSARRNGYERIHLDLRHLANYFRLSLAEEGVANAAFSAVDTRAKS